MSEGKSRLEVLADEARKALLTKNVYNSSSEEKQYSVTHPNALAAEHGSDDPRNIKGKGTGVFLDTHKAGSQTDIYGNGFDLDTGLIGNTKKNKYNEENPYTAPVIGNSTNQFIND